MFLKSASNLISSYPMSWYLIMPKQQLWGFKVSNGKKIIPGEALAFKHLDSEVTTVKVAFFREALMEVPWPRVSSEIGETNSPWKNGEISGDFSMGKTKTAGGLLKYNPGIFVHPSSLKIFHEQKKILPIFTPRSWRNPLVMECQSAAMHVVDFMRWSITLAVPISMSTGNMRDESGTNIRWFFFGWDFWTGFFLGEGKMGEKRPRRPRH